MKNIAAVAAAAVLALGLVSVGSAAQGSGTTTIVGEALEDRPVDVRVSIVSDAPIVPYEYSLLNQCWFSGRYAGHFDSYERFDLIGPWFAGSDGSAQTTVTINLQPVPADSACKVSVVRNNTTVKGSTTPYSIGP